MTKVFHFAELDERTQAYLLNARDNEGQGSPGIYVPQTSYLPWIGLILGPVLIIGILWWTIPSERDPFNTALLQMAAILPGMWMFIAAFRVWFSSGSASRPGHFIYVDPSFLYQSKGEKVRVTKIEELKSVDAQDNYNEGNYTGTTLTLNLRGGDKENVTISDGTYAVQFIRYLDTIIAMRKSGSTNESAGIQGTIARRVALTAAQSEGAYYNVDVAENVAEPPVPRATGWAPSGLIAILVILALAVGGVFAMTPLNRIWRDDAFFELVKHAPFDEKGDVLRAYLIDARNTRHRDKAEQQLAELYVGPIQNVKANARDPELAKGMVAVLTGISKAKQPLLSIRVKEDKGHPLEGLDFLPARSTQREQTLTKRLANSISMTVGKRLAIPVELGATEESLPVMVQIDYKFVPVGGAEMRTDWTITIRERPESAPIVTKTIQGRPALRTGYFTTFHNEAGNLMRDLIGKDHPDNEGPAGPGFGPPGGPGPF